MANPNEAAVAMTADILPINPNQGLDLTESPIMHVMTLKNYRNNILFTIDHFLKVVT